MQYLNKVFLIACAYVVLLSLAGCYKDVTLKVSGEKITRTVSFSSDIIPIFNSSCNYSGCHSAGGKSPNLTSVNAYNSLINGGYINTDSPESSELYLWMTGQKGTPMPTSGVNDDYNALVLAWIEQGALNN